MSNKHCPVCGGLMGWITSIGFNPASVHSGWRCRRCRQEKTAPKGGSENTTGISARSGVNYDTNTD